eukprot:1144129-Pelagomonas_calceolata.AAC.5
MLLNACGMAWLMDAGALGELGPSGCYGTSSVCEHFMHEVSSIPLVQVGCKCNTSSHNFRSTGWCRGKCACCRMCERCRLQPGQHAICIDGLIPWQSA